jgi:hypothetical protein
MSIVDVNRLSESFKSSSDDIQFAAPGAGSFSCSVIRNNCRTIGWMARLTSLERQNGVFERLKFRTLASLTISLHHSSFNAFALRWVATLSVMSMIVDQNGE